MASEAARAALVARLERDLRQAPRRYRIKLALLAALGYLVLGGAVVAALSLSLGLIALLVLTKSVWLIKLIKLIWIPLVVAGLILRALWVRIAPPEGERVSAREAPALLAEVERIRLATGAPRLAGVMIDPDLNAAAASVPRLLGLLGHRHWLVLGLPLMQALDRAQFASVVAHEFGHFGHGDGRFGGWIYRLRTTWARLLQALHERSPGRVGWLQQFFGWYAPYFETYSYVLARRQETLADAAAARVAGPLPTAQALLRINLAALRLEQDFWPSIRAANLRQAEPPRQLFDAMAKHLATPAADEASRLQQVLARAAALDDTHPAPAQRLAALGVAPALPPPPDASAAALLLGDFERVLCERFAQRWQDEVAPAWSANHQQAEHARTRLAELEAQGPAQLEAEPLLEYALLLEDERGGQAALPWLERVRDLAPASAQAHFALGRLALEREDAAGIALLRRAVALDERAMFAALQLIGAFHARRGEQAELQAVQDEHADYAGRRQRAEAARRSLSSDDELQAHGLEADVLAAVTRAAQRIGAVKRLWIVRKSIGSDGGVPHFVVLVQFRSFATRSDARLQAIADGLELCGSVQALKVGAARNYERRLRAVAGAPLLPRAA